MKINNQCSPFIVEDDIAGMIISAIVEDEIDGM